jgi:hypothetical protein
METGVGLVRRVGREQFQQLLVEKFFWNVHKSPHYSASVVGVRSFP